MKTIFALMLALALVAGPLHALESSGKGSDATANGAIGSLQIKNMSALGAIKAAMSDLQNLINQIMACQTQQMFWNGSSCFGYQLLSYQILPTQTIPANHAEPWQLVGMIDVAHGSGLGGLSGGGCNYYLYHRTCDCTAQSMNTSVVVKGSTVIIGPVSCSGYQQEADVPCNDPNNPAAYGPANC